MEALSHLKLIIADKVSLTRVLILKKVPKTNLHSSVMNFNKNVLLGKRYYFAFDVYRLNLMTSMHALAVTSSPELKMRWT